MVILGILGTCMHINGSAILQKRSTPKQTKFNCQIDDWQLNLRVQPTNDLTLHLSEDVVRCIGAGERYVYRRYPG